MKHIIAIVMLLSMVQVASAVPLNGTFNQTLNDQTGGYMADLLGAGVFIVVILMGMQLIGLETFFGHSVTWFMSIILSISAFLLLKTMGYM